MALYDPDKFTADITDIFNTDPAEAEKLEKIILNIKVNSNMTWEEFNNKLKDELTNFMTKLQPGFSLPEVDLNMNMINVPKYYEAKTFDEICAYLDKIKGSHIEDDLKRYILKSQNDEEKYNYFARLYEAWDSMKPKQKEAFLCCYAEIILTQQISHLMLNWIITTFAKVFKEGIDSSLEKQLSGDAIRYEKLKDRGSILHLTYAVTFVDADDDKEKSSERSREVLCDIFSKDDYNPGSFLDVTYYYAIYNQLVFSELKTMLRKTAEEIILNLFGNDMSDAAKSFSENNTLADIERFLDFNTGSVEQFQEFIQSDEKEAIGIAESKMKDMGVNYFNNDVSARGTDTYTYYQVSVEPEVLNTNQDDFCKWMAEERRFYESYYDIDSKTRTETLYGHLQPGTETYYAYIVVHKNYLLDENSNFNGLNKLKWKNELKEIKNDEERKKGIEELLYNIKDKLDSKDPKKCKNDYSGIRKCIDCFERDPHAFAEAVNDELKREKASVYDNKLTDRSEYLLRVFEEYCEKDKGSRAISFQEALSGTGDGDGDAQMQEHRWPFFSSKRYQDAMLYMCLNSDDPKEMFDKINNTPGYDYFQDPKKDTT